jgi:hypothetical protein
MANSSQDFLPVDPEVMAKNWHRADDPKLNPPFSSHLTV